MISNLLFVHALSPLHAGTGQGIGVIDLPIAKEKSTGLPFLPGSSVKGTLRDLCTDAATRKKVFGPDSKDGDASEHAGAAQFSDQRLLLLPVRSLVGTFAWVTSPYVLRRFLRDAIDVGSNGFATLPNPSAPSNDEECLVVTNDAQKGKTEIATAGNAVYLEDLDLTASPNADAAKWAEVIATQVLSDPVWQKFLRERFCIVSDNVMSFLVETATEVSARIKLEDDSKTVADGSLWYEEALPCETVLYGIVIANEIKASGANPSDAIKTVSDLINKPVQFGGKATVGRGMCRLTMAQKATMSGGTQ